MTKPVPGLHSSVPAGRDGAAAAYAARRSTFFAAMVPAAVATLIFVLYFQAQPHWLADPDAQDYAQIGRQLASGRGITTHYLPWNGAAYLSERGAGAVAWDSTGPWPNIARFPLMPVLMAAGFSTLGLVAEAVHLPAGLGFILAATCAGWLGARVYGPWEGMAAGLIAATFPMLVNYTLTGLTEPLLGMLILGVLACVVPRGGAPSSARRLASGGLLFGLAVLNRYDTALLVIPLLALWLLPRRDRWRAAGVFLVPAALLVIPWAMYLWSVAGAPLFNLQPASIAAQASGRADGLGWYLPEYVHPTELWATNSSRAARLAWDEFAATPNHLRKLLGWSWLLGGAGACLLAVARATVRRTGFADGELRLVLFLLAAILLRAGLASLLGLNLQRHFVPLVPLLVVVVAGEAVWGVRRLLDFLPRGLPFREIVMAFGQAAAGIALLLPGLMVIWPFLVPPSTPPGPPTRAGEVEARPENFERLIALVPPDALVASNVPWSVAWQADRRAVPLPPTVQDTPRLEARFGISIDAIYVAGQVSIADAPRSWRAWDDLRRRGEAPPGFRLAESTANGGRLYLRTR